MNAKREKVSVLIVGSSDSISALYEMQANSNFSNIFDLDNITGITFDFRSDRTVETH